MFVEGAAPHGTPTVVVRVESTGWVPESDFVEWVRDELPANVRFGLYVGDRQLWPVPVAAAAVAS